jgi:hypothetical protein
MEPTIEAGTEKIQDLAAELHQAHRHGVSSKRDMHEVFDLDASAEMLSDFLSRVKA